jgi:hypothetical protein
VKSNSDREASESQLALNGRISNLLESNVELSRRLAVLEDYFDARSIISRRQSHVFSLSSPEGEQAVARVGCGSNTESSNSKTGTFSTRFEFESDLEASRVYRRAARDTVDFSFRSSIAKSNTWSIFSCISLSDISIISVIALPINSTDITNGQHYTFGAPLLPNMAQTAPDGAGASMAETRLYTKETSPNMNEDIGLMHTKIVLIDGSIVTEADCPMLLFASAQELDLSPTQRNRSACDKLVRLSFAQLSQLSCDVYEELIRRDLTVKVTSGLDPKKQAPAFLPPQGRFHPKRNQARQKLATLSEYRFMQLLGDSVREVGMKVNAGMASKDSK